MSKPIDLTGLRFGKLIVIKRTTNNKCGSCRWVCKCDCKQKTIVFSYNLKRGNTQSCGCLAKTNALKHGHAKKIKRSRTYTTWIHIIQRCTNPNNKHWKDYGGRGITVCNRWLNSFPNFLEDMGERPGSEYSIERKKNKLGYCKENCEWATSKEQNRNTRRNRLITCFGKTQCIAAWAEEYNILYITLWWRLYKLNWSIEKSLETPVKNTKRRKKK